MRSRKAAELMQEYRRGEPGAVALVRKLITDAGVTMDEFNAKALAKNLDYVERIGRLIFNAESDRNAALREIDRRHSLLGETLRRGVQEIEDGQFEVIEATHYESFANARMKLKVAARILRGKEHMSPEEFARLVDSPKGPEKFAAVRRERLIRSAMNGEHYRGAIPRSAPSMRHKLEPQPRPAPTIDVACSCWDRWRRQFGSSSRNRDP